MNQVNKEMVEVKPVSRKSRNLKEVGKSTLGVNKKDVKPSTYVETVASQYPDPKLHLLLSLVKSAVRLGGCVFGATGNFVLAFVALGVAELLGIVEELV